jgi:Xaa-Pro dipeptidase
LAAVSATNSPIGRPPREEIEKRIERVQSAMAAMGVKVLLLTSQDNFIYLTGFDSPTWVNLARPRYCVLPAQGEPILIVPTTNLKAAESLTWVEDIRTWVSPNPVDDGISLVADAVRGFAGTDATIGMEIGPQSRLGMPVLDFLSLRDKLLPSQLIDADALVREIRKVKSAYEIAAIRRAAQATSRAFANLVGHLEIGGNEKRAVHDLHLLLLSEGVQDAPYLVAESGFGGYPSLQMAPRDRRVDEGSILSIDVGCRVQGYYCDFNRNFAFGRIPDLTRRVDDALWRATEAGIRAAAPGATAGDVWRAQTQVLDQMLPSTATRHTKSGRMGHGIGLRLTEPPSIHPDDPTILSPGMVLTIEPSLEFDLDTPDGTVRRMLVHEENLVVTEDGSELLSNRASRTLVNIR